jgi:hypothetical protein
LTADSFLAIERQLSKYGTYVKVNFVDGCVGRQRVHGGGSGVGRAAPPRRRCQSVPLPERVSEKERKRAKEREREREREREGESVCVWCVWCVVRVSVCVW